MTLSFPPPKTWQDFETLTKDLARLKLGGDFDNYGRLGQSQNGIDIFGWDSNNKVTAIQCKHKSNAKASSKKIVTEIKIDVIDKEVALADTFEPTLDNFIIATTAFRDTTIQNHINALNISRKSKNLPKISIWTWEDFEEEIYRHSELQYIYYEKTLRTFDQYNKDKHILTLLKYALDRPAFGTEFYVENNCEDFIKAISDTQKAFSTGKLNDREGNPLSSSFPPDNLSNPEDRDNLNRAQIILQEIRDFVTQQIKLGNIIQENNYLEFRQNWEFKISDYLNSSRVKIIHLVNKALKRNNLSEIESKLLK
ncbi:hypothetical protein MKJ04_02640 [Pontibacter sp. E15-1]|uniref:hypothetical protein n=1 Tax=Pontibacter sp. E15-1 TaxID=2919918 RepID=UPI001F4F71D9|nr:hypothetical protein [Pontibacter sp. E15-1]MCJ8163721.1 hypothetical protein [Pontibacter sp. E15-1]